MSSHYAWYSSAIPLKVDLRGLNMMSITCIGSDTRAAKGGLCPKTPSTSRRRTHRGGHMDERMIIQPLDGGYFDAAVEMALENYQLERHSARGLSETPDERYFRKQLE